MSDVIERAIEAARQHGLESEPDHEVGDLQALARTLAGYMTPDQIARVAADLFPPPPAPPPPPPEPAPDRAQTIAAIREALRKRSGKAWSVTGGTGTAWGWIRIDTQPARRTWRTRPDGTWFDTGQPGGHMGPPECAELAALLGKERPIHHQGESVAASSDYYREYIDRAEGRPPRVHGKIYWD